jgi:CobQ-like glutamine amidotransferase family enzyme
MADAGRGDPVRVALVFPSVLGTYGDGGNATVLVQRLRWRGFDAAIVEVGIDDALPAQVDLYVLGGGEDSAQTLAVSRLADGTLARAVDDGKPLLAVCAGFQILGETFLDGQGAVHAGLALIDCHTDRLPGLRAVGELLGECAVQGVGTVTGYENHGGRTVLGAAARPFAAVRTGIGNGDAGADGAIQGSIVATYLHGPALARNPALADDLLSRVCGPLAPLDDAEESELRRERMTATRRAKATRWRRQWRPPARQDNEKRAATLP